MHGSQTIMGRDFDTKSNDLFTYILYQVYCDILSMADLEKLNLFLILCALKRLLWSIFLMIQSFMIYLFHQEKWVQLKLLSTGLVTENNLGFLAFFILYTFFRHVQNRRCDRLECTLSHNRYSWSQVCLLWNIWTHSFATVWSEYNNSYCWTFYG